MRFRGWVSDQQVFPYSVVSGGAAYINVVVSTERRAERMRFLIDTGADATVLSPLDSWFVMGDRLLSVDFARDPRSVRSRGVGGGAQAIIRDATLTLRSTDGDLYPVDMPVLIAEPDPAIRTAPSASLLPSLLGRDFLRRFHLNLACGDPRSVALETL